MQVLLQLAFAPLVQYAFVVLVLRAVAPELANALLLRVAELGAAVLAAMLTGLVIPAAVALAIAILLAVLVYRALRRGNPSPAATA